MEYVFKSSAVRDLKKLPKTAQKQIISKLDYYLTVNYETPLINKNLVYLKRHRKVSF